MTDLIWVALMIFMVIAQLSKARNQTQLRGRPFEQQRRAAPQPVPVERPVLRAEHGQRREEPARRERVMQPQSLGEVQRASADTRVAVTRAAPALTAREPFPRPDLRKAVVWAEIIAPPVSRRRGRR